MNEAEVQLIKEALKLMDDALARLDSLQDNSVAHAISKIAHGAILMGELMLGGL